MSTFDYKLQHIMLEFEDDGSETKSWDYEVILNGEVSSYTAGYLTFELQDNKIIMSPKLNYTESYIASGIARKFLEDLISRILLDDPVFNFINKGTEVSFNKNMYTTMLLEMSDIGKDFIIR